MARYGTTFRVMTPDAAAIAKISLIRLGSVTHAFDMNQRYQRLGFTRDATGLTVTAPTNRNRTPPGHYMLFILNARACRRSRRSCRSSRAVAPQAPKPPRTKCRAASTAP